MDMSRMITRTDHLSFVEKNNGTAREILENLTLRLRKPTPKRTEIMRGGSTPPLPVGVNHFVKFVSHADDHHTTVTCKLSLTLKCLVFTNLLKLQNSK